MLYLKIASDKQGKKKDGKNWWMIILLHFFFFSQRNIQVPAGGKADATDSNSLAPVYIDRVWSYVH